MNNSRILRINNAKLPGYYFDNNYNIWRDFQIYISVPLSNLEQQSVNGFCVFLLKLKRTILVPFSNIHSFLHFSYMTGFSCWTFFILYFLRVILLSCSKLPYCTLFNLFHPFQFSLYFSHVVLAVLSKNIERSIWTLFYIRSSMVLVEPQTKN